MTQYHTFQTGQDNYLYLPNFKQLFLIDNYEYDILQIGSVDNQKDAILAAYVEKVNPIDYNFLTHVKDKNKLFGLFLNIANTCNMQCTYCFANQGDYGKSRGIMPFNIAKKAIDFFMNRIPIDGEAQIVFFGGEPLLAYDGITQTCEYVKSQYEGKVNYGFHIVTNATLLNKERIDFFAQNKFGVAISLDGGQEVQNNQRPLVNRKDSYTEVVEHLDYLLKSVPNVHARGTYSNFDISLTKVYKDLLSLGFKEVNVAPDILNPEENKDFDRLLYQLDSLGKYILEYVQKHDDFPFGLFKEKIRRMFVPKTDFYGCGLGETTFSVDYKGDIYPCHRFSSVEDQKMGNVSTTTLENCTPSSSIFTYEQCKSCWNRYTCSHGCSYNDYELGGVTAKKNEYWCKYAIKMTEISFALVSQLSPQQLLQIMRIEPSVIDGNN